MKSDRTIFWRNYGDMTDVLNPVRGCFVLGDCSFDPDGMRLLSGECYSLAEAEAAAAALTRDIRDALAQAKKDFTES